MFKKSFYFEIFAVSLAAILLEISYTRIFSFKVWYYFTYLIIGIALLGLGTGGILVAILRRLREVDPAEVIPKFCFFAGVSTLVGYLIIALVQLNISALNLAPIEIPKLVLICLSLMSPFLAIGTIISKILSTSPEAAGRLYGADLLGASLGCIVCIPLLVLLDPPRTIMLAGLILIIAGLRLALNSRLLLVAGGIIGALLILSLSMGRLLPEPVVDRGKSYDRSRKENLIRFSKWHPIFRVDVVGADTDDVQQYELDHDGQFGSVMQRFEGDSFLTEFARENSPRTLPFTVLRNEPKVLIIGSAGGAEILASLACGVKHVTGVELNPVTVSLLTDVYADFSGRLNENPRVSLVNGEGRWFMKQSTEKYDLIWFVAPDTYSAMNASSSAGFVLAESYLYTVEMLRESLNSLTADGVICTQFGEFDYDKKPNRTTRYIATARQAFAREGIKKFNHHVAVTTSRVSAFNMSLSTVVLSKSPLTFEQVNRFRERTNLLADGKVRYSPSRPADGSPVNQVITLEGSLLKGWYDGYPYLVTPVYDDSPYFWHFARFRNALASPLGLSFKWSDPEDSIAERVSFVLLFIVTIFAAIFLFLPFIAIHDTWIKIPRKWSAGVYFASLGLGFMFIEVVLIQMLTLFLGYPTYSLSVTLFGLLLFSGLGSLLSEYYVAHRKRALIILMAGLIGLVTFYQFGLPVVTGHFVGRSLALRIALTTVMLAPLGLCLGAFMPIGLTTIARATDYKREYVAWAWAVNGFFSVMASTLSTILAMMIGFKLVLLLALLIYAIGMLALFPLVYKAEV